MEISKLGSITINGFIGSGAYGAVYRGLDDSTGKTVAIKIMPKARKTNFDNNSNNVSLVPLDSIAFKYVSTGERVYREIALHLMVHNHPNIVSIHQVYDCKEYVYVVMDYFGNGDLFHAITDLQWYSGKEYMVKQIFGQLTDAISYCHSRGVYHCDLKPENILVSDDGMSVKIADFGLATRRMYSTEFGCGSSFYMSPERFDKHMVGKFSSSLSDTWALGIILLNLTCGRNPWRKASTVEDRSYRAFCQDPTFLNRIMPTISLQLNNILNNVFDPNPLRRCSLPQLVDMVKNSKLTRQEEIEQAMLKPLTPPTPTIQTNNETVTTHTPQTPQTPKTPKQQLLPAFESSTSTISTNTNTVTTPRIKIKRTHNEAFKEDSETTSCNNSSRCTNNYGLLSPRFTPIIRHEPVFKRPKH